MSLAPDDARQGAPSALSVRRRATSTISATTVSGSLNPSLTALHASRIKLSTR
ncbi:MAG TPA: hypothetical protein VLH81_11595 [Desulfobacterales bacterium]|nr:hypothetical protein [Desulfobacterales bacterium]